MHAKQELELCLMLPGKLHVCGMFSEGNSFATPKMLNGVIFISCEQILGERIRVTWKISYASLCFMEYKHMEWQCDRNSRKSGLKSASQEWSCVWSRGWKRKSGRRKVICIITSNEIKLSLQEKKKKSCKWKNTETTWGDKNLVECNVNVKYWGACFDFPVVLAGFQVQHCKHIWSLGKQKLKSNTAQ